ncbi:MAG: SpoIIE family protein phosphatase [Actinomycetota bacterium]|nr:SpoIIE family protein phosphatase [Actinomycetota bacterium]
MPDQARDRELEWGTATAPHPAQNVSGDAALVRRLPEGALVAVIDGLGHGHEAARAAQVARETVREAAGADIIALAHRCHRALACTRGAALALAYVSTSASTLTWLGVGNVEGRLITGDHQTRPPSANASLRLRCGVIGHQLPVIGTATLDIHRGDVLILSTDGITPGFGDALDVSGSSQRIAERILVEHWTVADDGLVLVLRYLGSRT